MPSEIEIINVALRKIGAETIDARTDGSANAEKVDDIYDEVRDALLRSHPWNFATKRQKLARLSTAPTFGFDYAYGVPSDWLRTISVHDNDAGVSTMNYRMEQVANQRCIVADAEDCYMRYVAQVTDPNLMAADFRRALIVNLAMDLALPIASSNVMMKAMTEEFGPVLAKAKSTDAMGGFPEPRPRGSWADSRGGYSTVWPR